jgi:hypothetical protein
VQDPKAVEAGGQARRLQTQVADFRLQSIRQAAAVQPGDSQSGFEGPRHETLVLQAQVAMAMRMSAAMVLRLDNAPARETRFDRADR